MAHLIPLREKALIKEVDVLIVGSGPIGATFARTLVDMGRDVTMIDIGEQGTKRVGDHKKNSIAAQKDISLFTNVVRGELHPLSVPTGDYMYLEPCSWDPTPPQIQCLQNGQNPNQSPWNNLPAAAATRVVGGMGSHWTCCTPREHELERSTLFSDDEWDELYSTAEGLFSTNSTSFDDSIRQQLVKYVLGNAYPSRQLDSMPLACERTARNKNYVKWSSTASILGDLAEPEYSGDNFEIRANTQCLYLAIDNGKVAFARVKDLLENKKYYIIAKKYVVCAGAILTPGILFKSKLTTYTLPALGKYMTDQTQAFCQVVLSRQLVEDVANDAYGLGWKDKVDKHQKKYPKDPLPFPFDDPDPQCYFPFSDSYRWHTQIHRDAFGYGEVPPTIDQRLVVDFRWHSSVQPVSTNYVEFSTTVKDEFGMPQPTFHFRMSDEDSKVCKDLITDMVEVSRHLGGFLPGAEPKCLPPGSARHICGTYRAGTSKEDSVVDRTGKVWEMENLVLGGCGVIPTGSACNPTLTAACFAIASARQLVQDLDAADSD